MSCAPPPPSSPSISKSIRCPCVLHDRQTRQLSQKCWLAKSAILRLRNTIAALAFHSWPKFVKIRVHFFGKIQNRIIAWDYTDSFLRKKQKIRKGSNRGLNPAKETKNPIFSSIQLAIVLVLRPLTTGTFFESFPKETKTPDFYQRNALLLNLILFC